MNEFIEFTLESEKEEFLKKNLMGLEVPAMTDMKCCTLCNKIFMVKEFKAIKGECECCGQDIDLVVCPNAPDCEGCYLDWIGLEMLN